MSSKEVVFADRMVGISIQGGLVRMELALDAGQVVDKEQQKKQRIEVTTRLVMPLEGFAQAVALQQRLISEVAKRPSDQTPPKPN